ncbi:SpoIID/LytB domain-containing protein, partial [Ilumatobacter sp.]|uniref:SpoIID/LytB domain-containing protein n=1 Tax=Ilumatobacter sp. TaxID=1967498 RepID=UPI002A2B69F0|nr:SpoIID/LytB domain-containing protein [Ilumatobacter sp.]
MRTMRWSRLGTALAIVAGTLALGAPGSPTPSVSAAPNDIIAVVVDGTGYGHGRGMSQWGAYGYAVDHGWDWNQILGHYYGGTDSSTVPSGQRIRVRLTGLDGAGTVGVVSYGSPINWKGVTRAAMYAEETSTPGEFRVYGSTARSCPGQSTLTVPSGLPEIAKGSLDSGAVTQIQTFLKQYQSTVIAVDGDFGNQTRGYLIDWQNAQSLTVDGIWNPEDAARARSIIDADSGGGFTLLGTATTGAGNPLSFTIANGDTSSIAPNQTIGLCARDRTITHYRGSIDVLNTSSGNRVVNDVKVEDYLRGVLPKEISASWANAGGGAGANAVRAQAVAARSYGLQQARSYFYDGSSARYASTCDTTSCQVYGGAARRSTASGSSTSVEHVLTDAAAVATANVVRRWPSGHSKGGQIVSTEFSASNGPRTAGGEFPPVDDIGDDTISNPNHRWTRVIDADTLESRYGLGQITSAAMTEAAQSQYRSYDGIWFNDIVLTGTRDTERMQAWDFRRSFNLPSPGFTVRVIRENTTSKSFGMIGDSVGESIAAGGISEFNRLIDGTFASATISTRVGRCTTRVSCPGTSGVEQAALLPTGLDLVVVELGYNDIASTFASDIDAMMNALTARGVARVAWVNMADIRTTSQGSTYGPMNAQLSAAESRWSTLTVLDWNAASASGEARARWFADGVHLTTTGQAEFALWLRGEILGVAPSHYLVPPKQIRIPIVGQQLTTPAGVTVTVPSTASAVAINVTSVRASLPSVLTVWPCESKRQETSNLNMLGGDVIANNVIASIDSAGEICLFSTAGTDVIVDVTGWFEDSGKASALESVSPERIVDSRIGLRSPQRRLGPATPLIVDVVGLTASRPDGSTATAPRGVSSIVINLTAVNAAAAGFFTVWPCAVDREETSSLNYRAGHPVANGIVAAVDVNGQVCVHSKVASDVVIDLQGWFGPTNPAFSA